VRENVFMQMSRHAWWTAIFGMIQMLLYFAGEDLIQVYSKNSVVCDGTLMEDWVSSGIIGSLFFAAHCNILTLSAATIVTLFYSIPREKQLINKIEVDSEGNNITIKGKRIKEHIKNVHTKEIGVNEFLFGLLCLNVKVILSYCCTCLRPKPDHWCPCLRPKPDHACNVSMIKKDVRVTIST
jgi:hypothetical protein